MTKKNCFLFLFLLLNITAASAQNRAGDAGDERVHVVYTAQYNAVQYKVFKQAGWQEPYFENSTQLSTGLDGIRAKVSPGFGIGVGLGKNISERVELRLIPTFVLNDRLLIFRYKVPGERATFTMSSYEDEKTVQGALVELPFSVKLKSDRRKNFGAYLTGGAKYAVNLTEGEQPQDAPLAMEKLLRNTKTYFSYEAGMGFDFFFRYFKLSPELKYSATFNNVLKQDHSPFSSPLDQLKLRQVTFSLYIQ